MKTSGPRSHHHVERAVLAQEIRREHLDRRAGAEAADRADRVGEMPGPAIGEIVAVDGGDDDVLQPELGHRAGDVLRLVAVERAGQARLDVAEGAGAGAGIAQDHQVRGVALGPALADIRARRFFADRMEPVLAHDRLGFGVLRARRRPHTDPLRLALDGRIRAVCLLRMADGLGSVDHDGHGRYTYTLGSRKSPASARVRPQKRAAKPPFPGEDEDLTLATVAAASGEDVCPFDISSTGKSVFRAFAAARSRFGGKRVCIIDVDDSERNYDDILRGALALGHALKAGTKKGECIGVMLPTGAGAIATFLAVSAYGRVPAMLNFTSGPAAVKSALKTAQVKKIATRPPPGRDGGACNPLVEELSQVAEIVYLEDVRKKPLAARQGGGGGRHVPARPRHVAAVAPTRRR